MQHGDCEHHEGKQERNNHRRHDPLGQTKLRHGMLLAFFAAGALVTLSHR